MCGREAVWSMVSLGQPEHTKTLEATQLLNMVDTQTCT